MDTSPRQVKRPLTVSLCSQDLDEEDLDNSFDEYCNEIANTAAWGGQAELNALANVLQQHIKVYAVGLPVVDMGKQYQGMPCSSTAASVICAASACSG